MERITVRVITGARKESLDKIQDGFYKAKLCLAPVQGKANARLLELLSEKLAVRKNRLRIIRGAKVKNKIIEICDE